MAGGIFTGNINLLCTSNMMIAMVLFACVSPSADRWWLVPLRPSPRGMRSH